MSRTINNFEDVRKELDRINRVIDSNKGATLLNLKGRQIKNVGEGKDPSDVVIVSQIPVLKNQTFTYNDYRTLLWSNPGFLYSQEDVGSDKIISDFEWYEFGRFLASDPVEFWVKFVNPPSDGSATFQLEYQLDADADKEDILGEPLEILEGSDYGQSYHTSGFTSPVKSFAERSMIRPKVITHGEISIVSVGVVVSRKI